MRSFFKLLKNDSATALFGGDIGKGFWGKVRDLLPGRGISVVLGAVSTCPAALRK
jgi:hypothetical protein